MKQVINPVTKKSINQKSNGFASFPGRQEPFFKPCLQPKSGIGLRHDMKEQQADAMTGKVMGMHSAKGDNSSANKNSLPIQRKCAGCKDEDKQQLQRKELTDNSPAGDQGLGNYIKQLNGGGQPLSKEVKSFFKPRFGCDFSNVKVHSDTVAAKSAQAINAIAYTSGSNIVFNNDQFSPDTDSGKKLLAHELTHVLQQNNDHDYRIQRSCSDQNFCRPYPTHADAVSAEWWLQNTHMVAEGYATYGPEVEDLYDRFLRRSPGDSLAPVIFNNDGSYVVRSFKGSGDTKDDMDTVIDLVGNRLRSAPSGSLRDNTPATMSLANFLSATEMDNRPINYSNPFSVAGHIAGGIGSSDAGDDYRKITYANVTLERVPVIGSTGYVLVELFPHYEVFDAIDFCPGDCGSYQEQVITIPMSRLEASGEAYDVPFKIIFTPDSRSKRFWF